MHQRALSRARALASRHHVLLRRELDEPAVDAVWLVGSAALGDLTPDSDVDAVVVTDETLQEGAWPALRRVHAQLQVEWPDVRYDATYLDRAALARPPRIGAVTLHSRHGELRLGRSCGAVQPVTWLLLPAAVPVAGARPYEVSVAVDREAALRYSRDNLEGHWAGVAASVRARAAGRDPQEPLAGPEAVLGLVLAAPRSAAFLAGCPARGPVPSTSEAGAWVAAQLPQHADLARRALAARAGECVTFTVADALEAAELVSLLIAQR